MMNIASDRVIKVAHFFIRSSSVVSRQLSSVSCQLSALSRQPSAASLSVSHQFSTPASPDRYLSLNQLIIDN
jgi:hypothetical protein